MLDTYPFGRLDALNTFIRAGVRLDGLVSNLLPDSSSSAKTTTSFLSQEDQRGGSCLLNTVNEGG